MTAKKKSLIKKAPKITKTSCPTKKNRHKLAAILSAVLIGAQFFAGGLYINPRASLAAQTPDKSEIISITNNYRTKDSKIVLTESPVLDKAAEAKLVDMQNQNYWDHTSPSGVEPWYFINNSGYNYSYAGENLGKGFTDASSLVTAWMNSPKHRDNLLSPNFTEIGVAVGTITINGKEASVMVQMFGQPKTVATATSTFSPTIMGATSQPSVNITNPVATSKLPFFILWAILFSIIVFDGIELRRCGLHTSKKHMREFRTALIINCFAFMLLFVNIVSLG